MTLVQIIYVSRRTAADRHSRAIEWSEIAKAASSTNSGRNVTGFLLASRAHFIQILEGPTAVVEDLFSRIERDARHSGVTCLGWRPIRNRSFARWGAACLETSAEAVAALARHGLTPSLQAQDLSMPTVLALFMELADAERAAEINNSPPPCPSAEATIRQVPPPPCGMLAPRPADIGRQPSFRWVAAARANAHGR